MAINLAAKYDKKVVERFKLKSLTEAFINRDYDWTGVETVKVYSIPTVALNDYTRTGTSRYGTPTELDDTIQEMKVTQDKSFTFTIDKGNKQDSMNVRDAGKALGREIDEVIVPTKDKYRVDIIVKAGIKAGDVIIQIDGKDIKTMDELNEIKNTHKIGDEITLKINRNGKEMDVKVTLQEQPSENNN